MPRKATIRAPIIVVDADDAHGMLARQALDDAGLGPVTVLSSHHHVTDLLDRHRCALVILDIPGHAGERERCLRQLIARHPGIAVVVAGANDAAEAIGSLRSGAVEYLVRPPAPAALVAASRRALDLGGMRGGPVLGDQRPSEATEVIGAALRTLTLAVPMVERSRKPLLIVGEAGTGKRRLACSIHQQCAPSGPFAAVFAKTLDLKRLKLCLAKLDGGTLFVDEITLLSQPAQQLLLRRLLEQEIRTRPRHPDGVRMIFANSPARSLLACNQRLLLQMRGRHLLLPPLRDCRSDIPELLAHLVAQAAQELGREAPAVPASLHLLLKEYPFPGNIRELRALVSEAVRGSSGRILSLTPFREAAAHRGPPRPGVDARTLLGTLDHLPSLRDIQGLLIEEALRRTRNHQSAAATMLGISRQALHKRLRTRVSVR